MIDYRQWQLDLIAENSVEDAINAAVQTTMADIENEINSYLKTRQSGPRTAEKVGNWINDKGKKAVDYLNSEEGDKRVNSLGKVFGLDKPGENQYFKKEIDDQRAASGLSPEDAARKFPYPTKMDNLKRAFKGSGDKERSKTWGGWYRDRFGNALGFQKEDVLSSLIETRDLQNLLYSCGVDKYVLTESNADFEQLKNSIRNHLKILGDRVKQIISPQREVRPVPGANMQEPLDLHKTPQQKLGNPAPQGNPVDWTKIDLPRLVLNNNNLEEIFRDKGQQFNRDTVKEFLNELVNQINKEIGDKRSKPIQQSRQNNPHAPIETELAAPVPSIVVTSALKNRRVSSTILNKIKEIFPEAEPAVSEPMAKELPPVPPQREKSELEADREKFGFVDPTPEQIKNIKRLNSRSFRSFDELKRMIEEEKIDPVKIVRANSDLSTLVEKVLYLGKKYKDYIHHVWKTY